MLSICVVIVSYHTGPVLFESIRSVLAQPEVDQLIVVDNGNPQKSIKTLQDEFAADIRLKLLTGHGNIGFARACNMAAEVATGDLLMLLNPDCVLSPASFSGLLEIAQARSGKWLLAPRLLNPDNSEQRGCRRELLTPWMAFVEGLKLYRLAPNHPYFKRFDRHEQPLPKDITEIEVTSGACMLMPLQVYRELGGMDEGYFLHVEDVDFCLRFRKAGGKIYFCPQVAIIHHLSSSLVSRLFVEKHKAAGFKRYFRKHFSDTYPSWFLAMVNGLITIRLGGIAVREFVGRLVRLSGRQSKEEWGSIETVEETLSSDQNQAEKNEV